MVKNTIDTVSETIDEGDNAVDLDQALSVAGIGWYNIRYSLALALFLISAIIDPIGYSFLLPAAKCDLQMTDAQRGVIGSIPYIGFEISAMKLSQKILAGCCVALVSQTEEQETARLDDSIRYLRYLGFEEHFDCLVLRIEEDDAWPILYTRRKTDECPLLHPRLTGESHHTKYFTSRQPSTLIAFGHFKEYGRDSRLTDPRLKNGVVATSFPWGYLVDTRGRKQTVVYSSLAAGIFGVLAAFMPDLTSFTIFKLLSAFCIACPASVPYSFIGEILPLKYRDITLSITNAMQISGSALVPLIAWAILPLDFRIDFGLYYFRPWRLLTIIYSSFFILSAILMSFGPESPKYLISQGKHEESLNVLRTIYSGNKRKPAADYPIKCLKLPDLNKQTQSFLNSLVQQTIPLLRPPYLKWLILNGTLFFGIFATLNGLYMWIPDILNRVITGNSASLTACEVIAQRLNETASENAQCNDSIDSMTFVINSIANFLCALIALGFSSTVKILGKKTLLILVYMVIGVFCVLINFVTQNTLFAILLSSIPITGLAIGPINAYAVEIFPTNLRGMAISLTMMIGRTGSIVGTNVAGLLINAVCELTFYIFGGMLILCGLLSFLLPRARIEPRPIKGTNL